MQAAPLRPDEELVLQALRALEVLDSEPEAEFDALVRAASLTCGTPIALISLVDRERQWFKANHGLPGATETPREQAFCAHAVLGDTIFEVADATLDPRFADNPLVTDAPDIRFYAGAPVTLDGGERIGTLCVIDRQPRQLDATQREVLRCLALAAARALAGRRAERALQRERQRLNAIIEESRQLEGLLSGALDELRDLYDNAPCAYYSLDADGLFVNINAIGLKWLGCTRADVVGRLGPADFFSPEAQAAFQARFQHFKSGGTIDGQEFEITSRDGTQRRVSLSATTVRDDQGGFVMSRSALFDITELHRVRSELKQLASRQATMLDNELVGIVRLRHRAIVWHNKAMARLFGYGDEELDGQPVRLLYLDDESFEALGQQAYPLLQAGRPFRSQLQMRRKNGEPLWIDISGALLGDEHDESMWLMVDITTLKQYQQQVEHIAFHDALTGLPNRRLLDDRLRQALGLAQRMGTALAVAYLDLDGFKAVNDQHGHEAGDRVLCEVAQRLAAGLRSSDTVARLGGDEFVLVLAPCEGAAACRPLLQRLLDRLAEPVLLPDGQQARVAGSFGVALFPDDGRDGNRLLELADAAMFQAKRAGHGGLRFHAGDEPAAAPG